MVSNNFINECKNRANKNRLGEIDIEEKKQFTGQTISIENTVPNENIDLTLYGKTTQETTTGKNLLQNNAISQIINGLTFTKNEDGTIKVNGTASAQTIYNINENVVLDGTYTITGCPSGGTDATYFLQIYGTGGINELGNGATTSNINGVVRIVIRNGTTLNNLIFNPMIRLSSITDASYEPYTGGKPSPSPDYPQPISTIENSLKITSCNKNLFDLNKYTSKGNDVTIIDSNSYSSTTCGAWKGQIRVPINVKKNTDYVISLDYSTNAQPYVMVMRSDNSTIIEKYMSFYPNGLTFNSGDNEIIIIQLYSNGNVNKSETLTISNIQLEKGTIKTNFEQHLETQITANLPEGEFVGKINDTYKDTLKVVYNEDDGHYHLILNKMIGKIVLDGSEKYLSWGIKETDYFSAYTNKFGGKLAIVNGYIISDHFPFSTYGVVANATGIGFFTGGNYIGISVPKNILSDVSTLSNAFASLKEWLSTHNTEVYYALATPYEVDLGVVTTLKTFNNITHITNSEDAKMDISASIWKNKITNSDNLQSVEVDSGCYVNGNIIGSVYAKCLKANFIAEQNNLTDKSIQAKIGVKYADLNTEYINIGKYKVERPNNEITANMSQITAYSDLYTNLDKKYVCNIDYSIGNKTVSDLYADVCNQLGLIPVTTEFINSTIPIGENPFTNGEKNRTVLQTIYKISCSFVDIDNDTNTIDLCWLSQNEEPDYTFYKNDYVNVDGGQVVCGPINCLIIKNSQIDDENVTIKDEESIASYGEHSITISEDYILHNAELRQQAITSIWNRVKGMKYVDCKLTTYYGKPFLKLGDKIRIYINDDEYFDTYVLKHKFTYDGTFNSVIESPALTEQEIKTKQDISLVELLQKTQIDVNKQSKQINAIVSEQDSQSTKISQLEIKTNSIETSVSETKESIKKVDSKIDDLQVGGRNYILNSNIFTNAGNVDTGTATTSNTIHPSIEDGLWKIVVDRTVNSNYHSWIHDNKIEDNLTDDDDFTFSFEIKSSDAVNETPPKIYFKNGMGYYPTIGKVTSEWSKCYYTGKWKDANNIRFHFGWNGLQGTYYIRKLKLEKGNKPTDWTPAPEDIDSDINDVKSALNSEVENLQNQIDGAIQFWNGTEVPTVSNYPANEWTTEELKNNHRADIYTVIINNEQGKSYRFDKVGTAWKWVEITDNELSAVKALVDKAQETADGKMKVFSITPTVPYQVGDIWWRDGEIYKCINAKTSGSFSEDDWVSSNYANVDDITIFEDTSGQELTLTNSAGKDLLKYHLDGNSYQKTTSGKNLLPFPYTAHNEKAVIVNGITFTDNGDGTITANGTATAQASYGLYKSRVPFVSDNYILSGCPKQQGMDYRLVAYYYKNDESYISGVNDYGNGVNLNYEEDFLVKIHIIIENGKTVNNAIFKPMLRLSSISDDTYEPYTGRKPSPSPDYPQEIEVIRGYNEFNAKLISNKNIQVNKDGSQITMPVVTSGNGITSTGKKLSELCPNLKVGDTVYLYFDRNLGLTQNGFIHLDKSQKWLYVDQYKKTLTQDDLDSIVYLGNIQK